MGWRFNVEEALQPLPDSLMESLKAQIAIVDSLRINPEIISFFHTIPLEIAKTTPGGAGAYSFQTHKMTLSMDIDPPENPVFLHELLHGYHDLRLPGGAHNATIVGFYHQALSSGEFSGRAYMLKNVIEFFAMCSSVVLWGRAARPPFTRRTVAEKLPQFYSWIVNEFSLSGV